MSIERPARSLGFKPLLINQLIERALSPPELPFNEALQKSLDELEKYSASSVAIAALNALEVTHLPALDQMGTAPWLSMLLLKWKLATVGGSLVDGASISQIEFDRLRQMLWLSRSWGNSNPREASVTAVLRATMAVQLEFQRPTTVEFLRWPALIARLVTNHPLRRQFHEAVGIEPEAFMDLCFAIHTAALESQTFHLKWFDALRPTYGDRIDAFLGVMARTLPALRTEVQADAAQLLRSRQELREIPYLRRYPLLRLQPDVFRSWHPFVLARGIEDSVHLRLSAFGHEYASRFGDVFEEYVLELLSSTGLSFIDDEEIQRRVGGSVEVVEAIAHSDECNILVEAKMGLFADKLLTIDDPKVLYERTKSIRKGIDQGWASSRLIRSRPADFGAMATAKTDVLLLVTSREMYLSGGCVLQQLFPQGRFDYPPGPAGAMAREFLPMQNIFIASIGDFERLVGYVRKTGKSLGGVLLEAATLNADARTARFTLGMHLPGKLRGAQLLRHAMDACGERLTRALDATGEAHFKSPSGEDDD